MHPPRPLVFQLVLLLAVASRALGVSFSSCLSRRVPGARMVSRGDEEYYAEVNKNHVTTGARLPEFFVFPGARREVRVALVCARRAGLAVCARSGGHSWVAGSLCAGVVVDFQSMKRIRLRKNGRVAIDAGVTTGELLYKLVNEYGLFVPVGTCTGVGFSGWALSGGIGTLTSEVGLGCDQFLRIGMFLANGTKISVSAKSHPDIFNAMCGGGAGYFGIVHTIVVKARPVEEYDNVAYFEYASYNSDTAVEIIKDWNSFDHDAVPGVYMRLRVNHRNGALYVFQAVGLCWRSDVSTCASRLAAYPFLSHPQLRLTRMTQLDGILNAAPLISDGAPSSYFTHFRDAQRGNFRSTSSVVWKEQSPPTPSSFYTDTMAVLARGSAENRMTIAQWSPLGGALRKRQNGDTAFRFRDAHSSWDQYWFGPPAVRDGFKAEFLALVRTRGENVRGTYANYPDLSVNVSDYYPGGAYTVLRTLKGELDPTDILAHTQPL